MMCEIYNMSVFLYFSALYLPHLGGVESYTNNLSRKLAESGNKVIIVTSALNNDAGKFSEENIEIYRFPALSIMGGRFPFPKKNALWHQMWEMLGSLKVDHVLINTRYYYTTILGLKFAKNKGIKAILIDHSTNYLSIGNKALDHIIRFYEKMITKKIMRYEPVFFSVSSKGTGWLKELGITARGVLPNAVDSVEFSKKGKAAKFDKTGEFHIAYAGRLIKEKGVVKLCKVVESLIEKGYVDIHLDIAGSGPAEVQVSDFAKRVENIRYFGRLNSAELASLLNADEVFCLPSDYPEGFPTVLLEAASCGMGIIMSDTGGSDELIPEKKYGIVLSGTTLADIEKAILYFYVNQSYLYEAADNVRKRVVTLYSWEETANKLINYCDRFG